MKIEFDILDAPHIRGRVECGIVQKGSVERPLPRNSKMSVRMSLATSVVLAMVAATGPAKSQSRSDPIGSLTRTSTFDRAQRVNVGKSGSGKIVCFTEDYDAGDAELYVGISTDGAFIRLEDTPNTDGPPRPKPPLRVFAGKSLTKVVDGDVKSTGDYAPVKIYGGAVDYVPLTNTKYGEGFVLTAKGDARSFFEVIVRAGPKDFIVVQSIAEPKHIDVAAIYRFKASTMSAMLSCAKKYSLQ